MRTLRAAARLQWWSMRGGLDDRQSFVLAPLFVLLFVGVVRARGHAELTAQAALGAMLVCLWNLCVQISGGVVANERRFGTFELTAAAPASFPTVVMGRVTTIAAVALLVVPEVWLATLLFFGEAVEVPHPGLFLIGIVLITFGMAAAGTLIAALFVLARNVVYLQVAFTYPFFILGGLVVPVSLLPEWVQPISRLVFLSWGSDLLRAALDPAAPRQVELQILGLFAVSALTFAAGRMLLTRLVDRARRHGTLGRA
ncbi:hypothetical protein C1I98_21240 [Spongiactinospora gelatinilytica]|uniref:ABC-2 type transporter transmembrane domain-containing protein n=1 Tax=Spongiactinospora gelatinilytica TaxID=2666298 RepID=A0A2W2GN05_9ACTN|nr:ABC transporter permease [Spongiactinospora gelatinilytica]PZG41435.1 hypothetical protein C1I98_21240 [Spongiactinospora gelatinilytica]